MFLPPRCPLSPCRGLGAVRVAPILGIGKAHCRPILLHQQVRALMERQGNGGTHAQRTGRRARDRRVQAGGGARVSSLRGSPTGQPRTTPPTSSTAHRRAAGGPGLQYLSTPARQHTATREHEPDRDFDPARRTCSAALVLDCLDGRRGGLGIEIPPTFSHRVQVDVEFVEKRDPGRDVEADHRL